MDLQECEICGHKQAVPYMGQWKCSQCGSRYVFDEGIVLKLSEAQKAVLRSDWLKRSGAK